MFLKSSYASSISPSVFITNGPCETTGSFIGSPLRTKNSDSSVKDSSKISPSTLSNMIKSPSLHILSSFTLASPFNIRIAVLKFFGSLNVVLP